MKIKWGALVVDGRGKLGGHVASQNKGGSYLRTKVTPSNPQTIAQSTVRSIFGAISQAWSGLTGLQIIAWNAAADEWSRTNIFGDIKIPSGKALFQQLNQNLLLIGEALLTSPPAKADMVQGVVTDATFGIGAGTLTVSGIGTAANANVSTYASGPVSEGTTFVKNKMRLIGFSGIGNPYAAVDGYDDYVARFGEPVVGQKIYVGFKYILDNGQASPLQTVLATVTA